MILPFRAQRQQNGGRLRGHSNGLNISGGDTTSNGMNETGWQKDGFNLSNYDYDSNTNPITASLSSGGAKSYYQTSARKSTSSSQHRSSLWIVCLLGEPVRLTSIFLCVSVYTFGTALIRI